MAIIVTTLGVDGKLASADYLGFQRLANKRLAGSDSGPLISGRISRRLS